MDPNTPPQANQPPANQPPMATPVARPAPPRPGRTLARLFTLLLVLGLLGSLVVNLVLLAIVGLSDLASLDVDRRVQEKFVSHDRSARDKVAIISVEGTILTGEGFVKRQIEQATKDKNVKAIVLRVNSPGGTITGSDYIYHHLRQLKQEREIPIVVSMGGLAASGGYYVSMACGPEGVIFAEPTTWTGSIGVIIPHYDLSELFSKVGVQQDSIASHRLKTMGSFAKPMSEEEREIFQELVDESFTRFKDLIKQGRSNFKQDPEALDRLATGQIFTAGQAKSNGLVDEIGFLEDAVEKAIELASLDKKNVKVIEYKREPTLADLLIGVQSSGQSLDMAALLDMTAPRAYYLCTWLPPLSGTAKP